MKIITKNKKAFHDYEIIKSYEAGISLLGSEVKSLRENNATLIGAFGQVKNNEIFLINFNISEYSNAASSFKHANDRKKRLLLHKKEIRRINQIIKERKLILVPLKVY